MGEIYKVDIALLKDFYNQFQNEKDNFSHSTYSTYTSSYLKNCSDYYVVSMAKKLDILYFKIDKAYKNISNWWNLNIENIEGLENALSNEQKIGNISEPSLRNYVSSQLPSLDNYNIKTSGIVTASVMGSVVGSAFTNNSSVYKDPFAQLYSEYNTNSANILSSQKQTISNNQDYLQFSSRFTSVSRSIGRNILDFFSYVNAKVSNVENKINSKILSVIENYDNVEAETRAEINNKVKSAVSERNNWWDNVTNGFLTFLGEAGAKISSVGETVNSKVNELIDNGIAIFQETKATISTSAKNIFNNAVTWVNDTNDNINEFFEYVGASISTGAQNAWSGLTNWFSEAGGWWNNVAVPMINGIAKDTWNLIMSVEATKAVFVTSLVEGVCQFGEAIVDVGAIILTAGASVLTGAFDGGQAIYGAITGNEWDSATKLMWGKTMGFVSTKHVTNAFNNFYDNTFIGNWMKENAFYYDTVRSIGVGIGYIAGVVVLTIATFGVGTVAVGGGAITASSAAAATTATQMAITATAAGIGRGTQNAWADGADLMEGLTAGTLTGLWEGLQFYVGGKISGLKIFGADGILKSIGSSGIGTKLLNGLARVVLDGVDGGVEGFVLPLITSIYKDGYYDENGNYIEFSEDENIFERYSEVFDDNGGWNTVWTQASIGSATSLLGEAFDLRKYFKDSQATSNINISEQELQVKIDRYNELVDLKNSNDYLSYKNAMENGDPNAIKPIVKPEFEGIEKEFATLEGELALIAGITSETDVDISTIMDDVETEKLFDYDGSQPTVDLFATEKIVPEVEATLDMFATKKIVTDNTNNVNTTTGVPNQPTAHLSFSKKYAESIKQLSDYYGDAGPNINSMFLQGKTAKQILDELDGQSKIDFQNFLQNTRQGQYLASLSDAEIRSMTTYTGGSYTEINGMLRQKNISGTINGMDAQALIDNMETAIAKYGGLEASTEIYRAVGVSAFTSQNSTYAALFNGIDVNDLNQVYSVLKVLEGKDFGDLGYMSTSPAYSASFAKYGSCPIVLDIIADEGTPGAYINQISNFYNSENEFLLARDTVLQMVEVLVPEKDINGLEKIVVRCVVK